MIAVNKKTNFINALIDAINGVKSVIDIGSLNITIKLIFSIISKKPVRKGIIVK